MTTNTITKPNDFLSRDSLFADFIGKYGDYPKEGQPSFSDYVKLRLKTDAEADSDNWTPIEIAKPEQQTSVTGISYSRRVEVLTKGEIKQAIMQSGEFSKKLKVSHWRYIQPATVLE